MIWFPDFGKWTKCRPKNIMSTSFSIIPHNYIESSFPACVFSYVVRIGNTSYFLRDCLNAATAFAPWKDVSSTLNSLTCLVDMLMVSWGCENGQAWCFSRIERRLVSFSYLDWVLSFRSWILAKKLRMWLSFSLGLWVLLFSEIPSLEWVVYSRFKLLPSWWAMLNFLYVIALSSYMEIVLWAAWAW